MPRKRQRNRRKLQLEALENRQLMAVISEIATAVTFGSSGYIELRGEPGEVLEDTHLVVIEGFLGRASDAIDLDGVVLGDNGYLSILPVGASLVPDPQSAVLRSFSQGYRGLPDGRFRSTSLSGNFFGSNSTYMLVSSATLPTLNVSIDSNSDGAIDPTGVAGQWTILDSVSLISSSGRTFGNIVFTSGVGNLVSRIPGATVVISGGNNYAGRIGESTGSSAKDWVAGEAIETTRNGRRVTELSINIFGQPSNPAFAGRDLDHLGRANFFGSIRGRAFSDLNNDAVFDPATESVLSGVVILADQNGNGVRDVITTVVDPEKLGLGLELTHAIAGVNMTTTRIIDDLPGAETSVQTAFFSSVGDRVIGQGQGGFGRNFSDANKLRLDFFRPARSVSVTFKGDFFANFLNSLTDFARLEAFDSRGVSLGSVESSKLLRGQSETVSIDLNDDRIAYALIYGVGNNEIIVDGIRFSQSELEVVTDSAGNYVLDLLEDDDYELRVTYDVTPPQFQTSPAEFPILAPVVNHASFRFDLGFAPNTPPTLAGGNLSFPEHPLVDKLVAVISAFDPNVSQPLIYTLVSVDGVPVNGGSLVEVEPTTGFLLAKLPNQIDFETRPTFAIQVSVTDGFSAPVFADFSIFLSDVNEPAVFQATSLPLPEQVDPNTVVGVLGVTDPDSSTLTIGQNRVDILSGNEKGIFSLDPITKRLTIVKPELLDFETESSLTLFVAASDLSDLPQRVIAPISIDLNDSNESPQMIANPLGFKIAETALGGTILGAVRSFDPDAGQSTRVDVIGGTGAGVFSIDPDTGRIVLNSGAQLDFETQGSVTLTVRISDNFDPPASIEETITVTILDVNEAPIINLSRTQAVLGEVSFLTGDQVLARVSTVDPDNTSFRLDITGGSGRDIVELTTAGELKLKTGQTLDFESLPRFSVVLTATETAGVFPTSSTAELNVRVLDENESPFFPNQSFSVSQTAPGGSRVGQLLFREPDVGQRVTLTVTGGDSNLLVVDSLGQVRLADNAVLNTATKPRLELQMRATDPLNRFTDATIFVDVRPANAQPTPQRFLEKFITPASREFEINSITRDLFTDRDGQTLTYSLSRSGAALPSWLSFDPTTLKIIGNPLPRDAGLYQLTIQATDTGSPPLTGTLPFEIEVTPVPLPWHNTLRPTDVDRNGGTEAFDALLVINLLNKSPTPRLVVPETGGGANFPDVNQDNFVSSIDALLVINELERQSSAEPPLVSSPLPAAVDQVFAEDDEEESYFGLGVL
jgi:hypothetical protein